ncbi:TPA: hypothetical protein U2L47_000081 [Citrobacter koseri]|nr:MULTISPECIES: hypothetical protein [Citrobacter]EKX8766050.1 hypothetical protein [Citrobacter koseri]ELJ2663077.1 hypothetical protein [Citrobacter koseri]MBJ8805099.1 hypothetical protein [Citrobacter koseri]MBJ9108341.1 hypothetical protein [Citrobacter koseri]MBJ9648626.1 hypothetical protein [Citrobacter koseri]
MKIYNPIVFVCAVSMLIACTEAKKDDTEPPYKFKAKVVYQDSPKCACAQSKMAYLTNTDPQNDIFTKYTVTTRLASNPSTTHKDNAVIAVNGIKELGCTKETNGQNICSLETSWEVNDTAPLIYTLNKSNIKGLSTPFFTYDNKSCVLLCNSKSDCYSFGPKAAQYAAPLVALVVAGQSKTDKTVTANEILKEYNKKPTDNVCDRGDITIKAGEIKNTSSSGCTIEAKRDDTNGLNVPLSLTLPKIITAQNTPLNSGEVLPLSNAQEIFFSDGQLAPSFGFSGPDAEDLNNSYGGAIRSITKIDDTIYVANTNGCVSMKVK